MKRVLCLIDSLGPGGAQRQIVGLSLFLQEKGYCVNVAAYHDNPFYVYQLLSGGVSYNFIPQAQKGLFRQWYLMRYINHYYPDVVISYLESPSMRACVTHLFNRKFKLIVSERNTTQHVGWRERFRFSLFRIADFVVPNSFSQADLIKHTFPWLENKVVTIPNFVDLLHFVPSNHRAKRDVPVIIVVATIRASKNTLGFIDAVFQLKRRGLKFHINWFGKESSQSQYYEQCMKRISDLEIGDCIELKEKTIHIKEQYQDADLFCLPSFYEGTPNAICEALACGLPVVCSNVCDNGRYVVDGENGFLFDPNDINSIINAVDKMLSLDKENHMRFGNNSRKRAEQFLSKDVFIKSYIELIES